MSDVRRTLARRAVDRVVESLRFTLADGMHEELHEGKGLQQSSSYIKGLTPVPYWDVHGGQFPWMEELEKHYETIRDELVEGLNNPNLERQGNSVWVAAVRDDAEGYGPDWRTLVLQDRCEWEPTNVSLFPKTAAAVKAACTPSVEVFFAKQAPKTGIKPHTDFTNFIMTAHLGLDCPPPPESWMKVGVETRYWENGKGMVADTSFIHSTSNESETQDRFVLIVRFWHPELTLDERNGVQFLFDAFEDPTPAGLAGAVNKAKARATLYATAAGAKKMGPAAPGLAPSAGEVEASTPEGGKGKGSGSRRKRNKRKNRVAGEGLGLLAKGMK